MGGGGGGGRITYLWEYLAPKSAVPHNDTKAEE